MSAKAANDTSERLLAPTLERACGLLQVAMAIFVVLAFYVAAISLGIVIHGSMTAWAYVYFIILSLSSLAIHEIGHLVGARIAGMTPIGLQIAGLFIFATRRGWRARRHKGVRRVGGYAIAFPNPERPMRKQFITMIAGGPTANLLVAVVAFVTSSLANGNAIKTFVIGLGTANALVGLANLVPSRRTFYSDGMALLKWRSGLAENDPAVTYARLMGRSVRGMTADRLPEEEVALVERQPPPFALVGFWLRLKASQNRHEWQKVDEMAPALERSIDAMTPEQFQMNPILIDMSRAEIAFSKAMLDRDARKLEMDIPKSVARWAPQLVSRIAALRAALAGDVDTRDRRLAECAKHAAKSVDLSLEKSEAIIRQAILDVAAHDVARCFRVDEREELAIATRFDSADFEDKAR